MNRRLTALPAGIFFGILMGIVLKNIPVGITLGLVFAVLIGFAGRRKRLS